MQFDFKKVMKENSDEELVKNIDCAQGGLPGRSYYSGRKLVTDKKSLRRKKRKL